MKPLIVAVAPAAGSAGRGSRLQLAEFRGLADGAPHIARVIYCDSRTGARVALGRIICAWFARCVRQAALVRPHPVLGDVPICADCNAKLANLSTGSAKTPPVHDDDFRWMRGLLCNPKCWTLLGPGGEWVAHVYRATDATWAAVWSDGELIADGLATSGEAMRATEDLARPCAHVDTDPSHGIVGCDEDREPGSAFCTAHARSGGAGGD